MQIMNSVIQWSHCCFPKAMGKIQQEDLKRYDLHNDKLCQVGKCFLKEKDVKMCV